MDIQLEKKKGLQKKHIPYVAGGVLFVILLGWIIFGDHASTLKVDARGISIGNVTREQFNDFFRMDGQVQPITVVQLSPEEGGIVQEKVVEEGAQVKKGDIIVRLSNSNLDLQILNAEAELAEKQNFLRNTQVTMEQDKLTNQMEKLQYDMDMNRARRSFNQQEQLYKENLIAKEDYLKAITDTATDYVEGIFQRLREHEYNPELMRLYVLGGGSCLIRNFGVYDASRVTINDDICATAKGYEYLAELNARKGNSR